MDTTAADIRFDKDGICNYCSEFLARSGDILNESDSIKSERLNRLIREIKNRGAGKEYDCIVGVSGGVDSSWVLVQAVRAGLRPLAVHMDNGWNSELAQNNIAMLVEKLGVDLYTHVIDWSQYQALMQSFFDADVIDVELLYDNAMLAVNYAEAKKYGISYILGGTNQATEGLAMPPGWNWFKYDKKNILDIHKKYSNLSVESYPIIGVGEYLINRYVRNIKWVSFLDNYHYNKNEALTELQNKYNFKSYPFKHYESIFTRFYQAQILPKKFGVDKRLLHLSTLVASSQLSRLDAISQLNGVPYSSKEEVDADIVYFLKKMNWSEKELENYLGRPEISHSKFRSEKWIWKCFLILKHIVYKIKNFR
jgi:N-acetyl sugar amidotransferase